MNTNQLKRFAQSARTQLMLQVAARLDYVLRTDTAELREKTDSLRQLQEALNADGRETLIEKVAYTWFNRFVALRFMDVNDYQPLGIRVVTPGDNRTTPQLLEEAKQGIIADELPVNRTEIMELLDGLKPSANAQNEAYKLLLTGACNHLSSIFPFLFERINDYTELLMPDDLVTERSFLKELREGMDADDCREVEIIGWLYQFYISEKKDAVFASKSSVKKEDIPAATQLFTPRWIVEYMVQNTVGKLWLQNRPSSRLRQHMPYYIESETTTDFLRLGSIEELRVLDQACGSGHILVYGFELLYRIYEEEGYNPSDIPKLIIEHNLYGFEIDERAAQLAGFALMMKARSYHRRFFRKEVKPNILCYADLKLSADTTQELFAQLNLPYSESLQTDLEYIRQSTNLGSLIRPVTSLGSLVELRENLEIKTKTADLFTKPALMAVQEAVAQLIPLAGKYHCVVDNPPYMGGGNMNKELGDYVKKHYPDSKADLMACFMEAGLSALHPAGMLGMINQHSWMFLSSYEKLRTKLIDSIQFDTLLHLGPRTFPEIGGEVVQNASFTFLNLPASVKGSYVRLVDFENSELKKEKTLEAVRDRECGWFYKANQKDFEKIPGGPIGYWLSERTYDIYQNSPTLKSVAYPRQGLATTNNELFLRYWSEVCFTKVGFGLNPNSEFRLNYKWFPLNKGGSFRKWYGNNFYVINFENNGKTICEYIDQTPGVKVKSNGRVINRDKYFCEGLTWSTISSGSLAMRFSPTGSIFETKGGMCFLEDRSLTFEVLGYLNSKISKYFLLVLSPTLDFHEGPLSKLPILAEPLKMNKYLNVAVHTSVNISKTDWDSRETSWDFKTSPLFDALLGDIGMSSSQFVKSRIEAKLNEGANLQDAYKSYVELWTQQFHQLHRNEEELNRQFIEIYGLQDELTPDVPLEDITILKEETTIENGELVFRADEVMAQFVSYAVGCMLGRYSIDQPGLILANQGETLVDYLAKLGRQMDELSFVPDADNIIPVLDDEWFEDDIVARFNAFLKASFGTQHFDKNIAFVEESLGMDLRRYFTRNFYTDHVRRYKKRPIYWMFSSPRGSFNVLIYMHRYTRDTLSQILNGYLREYKEKISAHIDHLAHIIETGSSAEATRATKQQDNYRLVLLELQDYERDILYPLATERIAIDLDDGVLVNYNKFGKAIKEVAGLNDKKTKEKVKGFDWIEGEEIR